MVARFYETLLQVLETKENARSATFLDGTLPEGVCTGHAWLYGQGRVLVGSLGPEDDAVLVAATSALSLHRPSVVTEVTLGGETTCRVLLELHVPSPRLLLVGAGHIARALSRLAIPLGFNPVVFDDVAERLEPEWFPEGTTFVEGTFSQAGSLLEAGEGDFAVIVTRGHGGDFEALLALVSTDVTYLGMIGSKRKVAILLEKARAQGVPQERLDGVFTPIGLDIGAETPEEIALSIAAEIVAVLRGRDPARAGSCARLSEKD